MGKQVNPSASNSQQSGQVQPSVAQKWEQPPLFPSKQSRDAVLKHSSELAVFMWSGKHEHSYPPGLFSQEAKIQGSEAGSHSSTSLKSVFKFRKSIEVR